MRPLEGVLLALVFAMLLIRWGRPRNRQVTTSLLAMLAIVAALHLVFDGVRWEMIPTYALGLLGAFLLAADLRRIGSARAGESGRFVAVASPARRALGLAGLLIAGAVALAIPALLFPRVSFPAPDGQYEVGRIEVFWTDSAREETLTADPNDRRGVWVTFWYPAEAPNGRPVRYHPAPRARASALAASAPLPAFTFWNLTRARTNATEAPRFSIREGKSPLLLFSHGFELWRTESTYAFETLASHGYVVASIEHTYAALGTVLPDGREAPSAATTMLFNDQARLLDMWTRDAAFVLDRLHALPAGDVSDTLSGHLQLDRVGYFGHSFGGTAAADLMMRDDRVVAGVNYDGLPAGESARRGVAKPFLVFTAKPQDADALPDAILSQMRVTRDSLRSLLAGQPAQVASLLQRGGTEIVMDGAAHMSFSDLPLWSPRLASRAGLAGTDDPRDVHRAVTVLTLRFFDQYLKGRSGETTVELPPNVQVRLVRHEPRVK